MNRFLTDLAEVFDRLNISYEFQDSSDVSTIKIEPSELLSTCSALKRKLDFIFLIDINCESKYCLVYHFYNLDIKKILRLRVKSSNSISFKTISHLYSNAVWFEREIQLSHNVEFSKEYYRDVKKQLKKRNRLSFSSDLDFYSNYSGGVTNIHYISNGVLVEDLAFQDGIECNQIEQLSSSLEIDQVAKVIQNSFISKNYFLADAYVQLIEKMFSVDVPSRALTIRMLILEISRISDHFLYFSEFFKECGADLPTELSLEGYFITCNLIEELIQKASTVICVGGVGFEMPAKWRFHCLRAVERIRKITSLLSEYFSNNNSLKLLLNDYAVSKYEVVNFGCSGVLSRASGLNFDMRKFSSYYFYDEVDFEVPLAENGTAYERILVMLEEVFQSSRILLQVLENIPEGQSVSKDFKNMDSFVWQNYIEQAQLSSFEQEQIVLAEGSNGVIGCYANLKGKSRLHSLKLIAPSPSSFSLQEKKLMSSMLDNLKLASLSYMSRVSEAYR